MRNRMVEVRRRGYTLVEILLVVLVFGILLSVAAPAFMHARQVSQAKVCRRNLRLIEAAKEQWALEHPGRTEPSLQDLAGLERYLRQSPICPLGGSYHVGDLDDDPTCSVAVPADSTVHVLR